MDNNILNRELEKAVKNSNLEKVKALLSAGANVNHNVDDDSKSLLHYTSSVEIANALLLGGAHVNSRNKYKETPLDHAVSYDKNVEFVRVLLKHEAYVNARNRKGYTALYIAVKRRNKEVIKELLKFGADINIRNWEKDYNASRYSMPDSSPLDYAVAKYSDMEYAELMIKYTLIEHFHEEYRKIIDLSPYNTYGSTYTNLTSYLDDCVREVFQMKADVIVDGVPLFELVVNNFNILSICNHRLLAKLANTNYSVRYPIYNDIIFDKIKPVFERFELLNKLNKIQVYTTVNLPYPSHDAKEEHIVLNCDSVCSITEYLSIDDLLNFVAAFDFSKKRAFQSEDNLDDNLVKQGTDVNEPSTSNNAKRMKL